ncbi:MAG: ABC transporter ATP-binding protein [Planctomycetes bacterium]|nr:ABC transporter ATP-binding protein [Planctomycetota bacterium]
MATPCDASTRLLEQIVRGLIERIRKHIAICPTNGVSGDKAEGYNAATMSSYEEDLLEDQVRTNTFDPVLLRRLLVFALRYKSLALVGFALVVLGAMMALAVPLLISASIDLVFEPKASVGRSAIDVLKSVGLSPLVDWIKGLVGSGAQEEKVAASVALTISLGVVVVARFLITWASGYILAALSQRVLLDIRMQLFQHIQTRALSYFHRNPVGRLITRVTNDVGSLDDFFSQALMNVLNDLMLIGGIIALMLIAHTELALFTLLVLPPMVYISAVFRKYARRAYRRFRAALSRLNSVMAETKNGVRVVQLFNRQGKNQKKYEEVGDEHRDGFMAQRFAWALYRPGYTILQGAALAVAIWLGGYWVLEGELAAGILVLFVLLADMFFQPIRDLVEKFDVIQSAVTSGERIFTVLDEKDTIPIKPDAKVAPRFKGEIEFKNVEFEYIKDEPVLRGVSFRAEPGQTIAIVGHTGAGKTTIINLLSRFYDIGGGQILIDGNDIRDFTLASLRRNVAVVHQDVFLFAGTIRDNLSLKTEGITQEACEAAARAVNVDEFIRRFKDGYDHVLEEQGKTFSAGERQLLSFARALAHDPSILILDEATSSIDTRSEMVIQDAMRTLMKGRTSIVIAHRLSTIQHADKILVMHKGKIAEVGTHQELLRTGGLYRKLYELQFASVKGDVA